MVTASDGKVYSRERLQANPMDLVYSLLVMIRAHAQAQTKSNHTKAATRRQCEGWIASTFRGAHLERRRPRLAALDGREVGPH